MPLAQSSLDLKIYLFHYTVLCILLDLIIHVANLNDFTMLVEKIP